MDREELFDEMGRLLDLITAEFNSDPMSVQCFDLGTVEHANIAVARWHELKGES